MADAPVLEQTQYGHLSPDLDACSHILAAEMTQAAEAVVRTTNAAASCESLESLQNLQTLRTEEDLRVEDDLESSSQSSVETTSESVEATQSTASSASIHLTPGPPSPLLAPTAVDFVREPEPLLDAPALTEPPVEPPVEPPAALAPILEAAAPFDRLQKMADLLEIPCEVDELDADWAALLSQPQEPILHLTGVRPDAVLALGTSDTPDVPDAINVLDCPTPSESVSAVAQAGLSGMTPVVQTRVSEIVDAYEALAPVEPQPVEPQPVEASVCSQAERSFEDEWTSPSPAPTPVVRVGPRRRGRPPDAVLAAR